MRWPQQIKVLVAMFDKFNDQDSHAGGKELAPAKKEPPVSHNHAVACIPNK